MGVMKMNKCYFCDNDATTTMECDDDETHAVCDGCATAWRDGEITTSDTVDACAICLMPIIYVSHAVLNGNPICDTCAREHIHDVLSQP